MKNIFKLLEAAKKRREDRLQRPFGFFAGLLPCLTKDTRESLQHLAVPVSVAGKPCPESLQRATYGLLCRLQAAQATDYVVTVCRLLGELLGLEADEVLAAPAADVLGAVAMIQREVERIAKLFRSVSPESTSDEIAAGVELLNFGVFGTADWYARRMGITDHEDVYNTPWARIYQCLKMDKDTADYERRLREVQNRRLKRRK